MEQQRETERTITADRDRITLGTPIVISTYNVRTLLYQSGKFHQLCIVGVLEHRLLSLTPILEKWFDNKNWLFIHNPLKTNKEEEVLASDHKTTHKVCHWIKMHHLSDL